MVEMRRLDDTADDEVDEPSRPRPTPPDPAPQRRPPADKPLDASMAKGEIARAICLLYNLTHRLTKLDKRYRATDFGEEADGLYDLIQSHAPLRVLLRLASPLAAIGALWEKVEDTLERLRARKAQAQANRQAKESQKANGQQSQQQPGGTKAPFRP